MNNFVARALFAFLFFIAVFAYSQPVFAESGVSRPIAAETGQRVQLDPTDGFSVDGSQPLRAEWTWVSRPDTSVASFSDAAALRPFVTVDVPGSYEAQLNLYPATDAGATVPLATTTLQISTDSVAPVAVIHGRGLPGELDVSLDGTRSYDVDGDALTYAWSVVAAPATGTVTFADSTRPLTDVALTGAGTFDLGLTVQDATGKTSQTAVYRVVRTLDGGPDRCRTVFDTVLQNDGSPQVTFELGDVTNGPPLEIAIDRFDVNSGHEHTFDRVNFTFRGQDYSLSKHSEFLHFAYFLEHDGDRDTDVLIGINTRDKDLTFTWGVGRGALTIKNVVGSGVSRSGLIHRSADFCGLGERFNRPFTQTLGNDGSATVVFDLGDVSSGPFEDVVIPSFDINSGREHTFDILKFTFEGKSYRLKTKWDFLHFAKFIEHDGDILTDAFISPNPEVRDFTLTWGEGKGSVTLLDVVDTSGFKRYKLIERSVDFYESGTTSERRVLPKASARFDQVALGAGETFTLDPYGSSDLDGNQLSAAFSALIEPAGESAGLSAGADGQVSVTPTGAGAYLANLRVSDPQGAGSDQVLVVTDGGNVRPVARILAAQPSAVGVPVALDGQQSYDLNGDLLRYDWSVLSAPATSVAGVASNGPSAVLTPDVDGLYIVQLIVSDGLAGSVPATYVIDTTGVQPVAFVGGDVLADAAGAAALDGGASIADVPNYTWSVTGLTGNTLGALNDAALAMPTLTLFGDAPDFEASVAQLIVRDGDRLSLPETVFATNGNARPATFTAAALEAPTGNALTIDGGLYASDLNGDALSYDWSLIYRPDGSAAVIDPSDPGAQSVAGQALGFTPDRTGLYLLQLTVRDDTLQAEPVVIALNAVNTAPVAVATGPATAFVGNVVTLDGSGSFDPNSDALSYAWTLREAPVDSVAVLSDASAVMPTFTPDEQGTYVFDLVVADFEFASPVASVTLDVPNRAPVAVFTGPAEVGFGSEAIFSAAGSFDLDGDTLGFAYAVVTAPAGADPMLMDLGNATVGFLSETAGDYVIEVTVSDGVATATQTVAFAVLSGNQAPILGPLNVLYTVELGLELVLDLTAQDPDGDALTFFADPLPLPVGVSIDAASGAIRFRPEAGQEGDYSFTVGVSDGSLTDRAVLNISVVPGAAGDTAITGRVLDAVDFANGIETPLAGIPVRLGNAAVQALTEADGTFSIGSLGAGSDQIFVEPSAAGGPGGYSADTRVITITENQIRDLDPDFLLTPLGDGCAPVLPGVETVLASAISGVTVTIGADTVQDGSGAAYAGEICLGSLPRLFEQPGLPEQTNACQIYALDAPGAIFTAGVTISGPNVDLLPAETQLELWRLSNANGLFRPAANASVDVGGATVSAVAQRFSGPSLFTFLPQSPVALASADMNSGNNRELTPFEGNLNENYTLPGYRAFNRMQEISLAYNSAAADPTVIVSGDVTISETASLPETVQTRIDLSGLAIDDSGNWTPRLGLNGAAPALLGEAVTLRQSMPFDATGLSEGRYDYTYYSSASYACSTVSGVYRGELYVQNQTESPYGQGWSIDELQKLVQRPDGKVAIIDDDSVEVFDPEPTFTEFDEGARLTFPAIGPQGISTADLDGDGDLDVVFGNSGDGTVRTLTNLGGREFVEAAVVQVEDGNEVPPTGVYFPNIQGALPIDLNGDTLADIAYTAQGSDTLAFLENQGLGAFDKQVAITNFGQLTSIAVDDIDGDGFEDAVFSRFAGFFGFGNTEIYVDYGGDGARVRQRVARQSFGNSGLQIETGDINGDGLRDIIYRIDDGIQIIINRGNRDFDLFDDDLGGAGTDLLGKYFDVADLNGDGLDDIIATHAPVGTQIFLRDPVGFFFPPQILPFPASATSRPASFLLDVQGDGEQDMVLSYGTTTGAEVSVYRGVGDGTFQPAEAGLLDYGIADQQAADVDGDGSLDLISLQRFTVTIDFSKPSADGNLVAGKGEFSTLVQLPDGGWERRYKDGNKVIFDAEGRQTAEVDTQGNRREFAYGTNGALASVTDQVGGVTLMAYDDRGRLTTVTYPDGRVTEMEYQDVQLVGVTEPDGDRVSFAYDEFGRLNSTINQNGNETLYTHDDTGRLNGATLPDGSSIRNQAASSLGLVDGLGGAVGNPRPYVAPEDRVTTVTDRKGELSEVVVNSFGSTIQITDPLGRVTKMERDFNDLVERLERPSDGTASGTRVDLLSYDGQANITQMIEAFGTPEQRVMAYVYEPEFSKVTSMTNGDGFTTTYAYDNFGEVTAITDPEGGVQRRAYTSRGKLFSRTDERGNVTRFGYLSDQNLGSITYADGSVTEMAYDAQGNATDVTEGVGTDTARTVVRTYDSDNRVTSVDVIDAVGSALVLASLSDAPVIDGVTTYGYDGVGNLTEVVDETGLSTTMTYDALERLVTVDDPAEGTITRTYNAAGEVTEHSNGDGATHVYEYDAVSRLTQTTDAEGFVKTFDYDRRDNVRRVVDGRGGETVFAFDGLDRMIQRTNPLGQVMRRSYDRRDNLVSLTREDGAVETATFDDKGRRIEVVTPDNTLRYAYDARDNVILAEDDDSRVTMTYDARNRLITTTTDGSVGVQPAVTLTYAYDDLDRRVSLSDSFGGVYGYGYDSEDRLTALSTPWGTGYGMSYDNYGRRVGLSSTSGRVSSMDYTNGLLAALTHVQTGVTLTDLAYQYDVDGQLIGINDQLDPSRSKGISYDDLNRLVQVSEGIPASSGGTPVPVEDYAYDEEGNRLASHLSALYTSDAHNRLQEDDDFTYGYDEKGNRISKTAKANGATELYEYDSQNRLITYTDATGAATEYHYDAMERRIAKVQGRIATAYIYDTSITDPLAFDDILLEFTVVGPDDGGGTGGGGGNPAYASCNAQFQLAGIVNRDLFGSDFPLPGLTTELIDSYGGPDAVLTFDLLIDAGGEGFLLQETLSFVFRGEVPPACLELLGGPGGPGGPGGEVDPEQVAECNVELGLAGITRDELLQQDLILGDSLRQRLEGPEGAETMTVGFLQEEGFPLFIVPDFFEIAPPACIGLEGDLGPFDPELPGPLELTASTLIAATVADFNSEEAESVTLVRRWAHTNMVDEPIGFEAYADDPTPGAGTVYEMYADRLGSILAVVDIATNAIAVSYDYDGFGNRTATGDLDQPYGYTGREFDGESGLYHYRARSMDPVLANFVQTDPIGFESGSLNLTAYVENNPTLNIDPGGLTSNKKGKPRHPEMTVMDFAKAEIREAAIEAVASGVFSLAGQIVGNLAYAGKLVEASAEFNSRTDLHHCFPQYLGGDNRRSNLKKIDRAKHRLMHKAMRLYLRSYDLDYAPGYGGKFIRKRFPMAQMQRITRNFYKDMKEQFDIDFGC
ncbi:PKD domain-containing protein [Tateyamaria sp. SN3-11]|uniref:PKD domain-containing protein n=1 Tax=Tateyamaria sp. SN3-11 TaxID=3092147 RepID=UPI0039E88F23